MLKQTSKSYIMIISAMLIFGTIGIFRKYIPLSSGMLAFIRGLLGSAFLILFVIVKRHKLQKISARELLLLAVTGVAIGFNWILLFEAYNYTTVATATMCYYMQPTIVILVSPLVLHERLTLKKFICALTAVAGMFLVSGMIENGGIGIQDATGILCGLGAAALYATVIILNKKIQTEDAYEKTIIQLVSATVILIPYLLVAENGFDYEFGPTNIIMVLIVGIVHTGIAYALYFGSMKALKAQSIAVLSYIDPVFALILSAVVLQEGMSVFAVVGSVMIIDSALVSELNIKKQASRKKSG